MRPATRLALLAGWLGYALIPWYLPEGMSLSGYPFGKAGTALALVLSGAAPWLAPVGIALVLASLLAFRQENAGTGRLLAWIGFAGLAFFFAQGFAVTLKDQGMPALAALLGGAGAAQPGMGFGLAASKRPNANQIRLVGLINHVVFGLGLWLAALLLR